MKKLLFAIGSIAAMVIISSCSTDNIEEGKTENLINKNQILPSVTTDSLNSTTPQNLLEISDKDKNQG
ncbi:hypothetical protein Q1W71_10165 [Flavobacterium pectinovorum]|uniref:hypothetical protein n=1 Tax=Flavobacterium pectinovorum TaxID=29533 RepID=UPI00265E6783|nr:hypothetical protein [Flavobacterium pectinovorum]WKL50119.1 hypothetical protein Q1W71_10165 [Flavobacterium pectinovorum]